MKELIKVNDVFFRYSEDANDAVKGVSFSVFEGEWLAIVGHNGSGKSTLAKLLNGLLQPYSGQITVASFQTDDEEHIWDVRRRVGIVFQNPDNQFVGTTVMDDIAFGLENNGVPREEMLKRIDESMAKVNVSKFLEYEPHRLSGGQKQRVAIAGVIALKPEIIILDEATSMLDPRGRKEVIDVVKELNEKENITVISITHDLEEAMLADRMIVMNRGEKVLEGEPATIFVNDGERLKAYNLDLPFSIQLKEKLLEKGLALSGQSFTHEELVDELWRLTLKT
ncbi:energy-coupling factor ABC transporter ATP-binding protein [Pueribacillus sp. YX66]|uniref:energy-coupling factor ABC transporter ATP-binding protein n=1 Tax=Pueribacillus sp. YX66 TaxID=3229242 RepID=UPI00358D92FA